MSPLLRSFTKRKPRKTAVPHVTYSLCTRPFTYWFTRHWTCSIRGLVTTLGLLQCVAQALALNCTHLWLPGGRKEGGSIRQMLVWRSVHVTKSFRAWHPGPGEVEPALPRMWRSSPIVRPPIQRLRTSRHLSCPETDRAGENSHVKVQDLGGKTCLLWQTFFVQRDFWTEGSCHVSLRKSFCFNDTAQSKKKESVSVFYLSNCCPADPIENISND